MFNRIPIPGKNGLGSERNSLQCCFEMLSVIDEKHSVFDVVFLMDFLQELFS